MIEENDKSEEFQQECTFEHFKFGTKGESNAELKSLPKKEKFFIKKRESKINKKKKNKTKSEFSNSENSLLAMETKPKTILEIINDSSSGIPMPSEAKNKSNRLEMQKRKKESLYSDSFSVDNSNISPIKPEKHFLRSKNVRTENVAEPQENYGKYFRPQLIWDPVLNKMIIEKPKIHEASRKMQEDILKRSAPVAEFQSDNNKITSMSFRKNIHTKKWSEEETNFFYKSLECFGTDFSLIEIVLKPRTRHQIKNKYRKEEKENKTRVEDALSKYDPKKIIKILSVLQQYRQELNKKTKKRTKNFKKDNSNSQEAALLDFKKIFKEIEDENEENLKQKEYELDLILGEEDENSEINPSEFEKESSVKTISVNENNYIAEQKSEHFNKQNSIEVFQKKTSKVKVIINNLNKSPSIEESAIQNSEDNNDNLLENIDKNSFGYDFLKNYYAK